MHMQQDECGDSAAAGTYHIPLSAPEENASSTDTHIHTMLYTIHLGLNNIVVGQRHDAHWELTKTASSGSAACA